MTPKVLIGLIFLAVICLIAGSELYQRWRIKRYVRQSWERVPNVRRYDAETSLMAAWQEAKTTQTATSEIDDWTWSDLAGFDLFQQLNLTFSSIGSERLYQSLRHFDFSDQRAQNLETLIAFYKEQPTIREKVQFQFARLGKKDHNYVQKYLNQPIQQQLTNFTTSVLLGILPLVFCSGLLIFKQQGWALALVASIVINTLYYQTKKQILETELASMSYFVQSIACAQKLAKLPTPYQQQIQTNLKQLKKITRVAFSFRMKTNSEADLLLEYVSMIFMLPFISYNYVLKQLKRYNQEAKTLWQLLGELEVAYAIQNYRQIMPSTSQPVFKEAGPVQGEGIYHPLITEPVTNPVTWQGSTLITGSNASGKSTYVKSIAINCWLAQTIHTVLAEKFELPYGHVLTAMAVEDDLIAGDSYFVAEIKSLKRLIEQIQTQATCFCFIDELLKGTNTIERIAASTGIIQWLQQPNVFAIIATHDIELTEILQTSCQNVHFEEQVDATEGITFDYLLKAGPATGRNAIRLLEVLDYPPAIVTVAEAQAHHFDEQRQWKPIKNA